MHYFRLAAWMNKSMTVNDDKKRWHKRASRKKVEEGRSMRTRMENVLMLKQQQTT
jgi:hypothetical protein